MWCIVSNKPKHEARYRLDRSHLMNIPIKYDDGIEHRNTHPALLDKGNNDTVMIPPLTQKQPEAVPKPVCRGVSRDSQGG